MIGIASGEESHTFYIHKSINYEMVTSLPENSLEILCIKMKPVSAQPFYVLNWYQPPSSRVENFAELKNVLRYLESYGNEIFLLGGTNCNLLEEHIRKKNSFGFKQLIEETTRETIKTKTLLDHIATTKPANVMESGICSITTTNHYLIYCIRKFRGKIKRAPKIFESRQLKKFDKENLSKTYTK